MGFLKNLTVSVKVGFSFTVVVATLLVISTISYFSIRNIYSGFVEYRSIARDTNLAGRLQANMLMVRMGVKNFIISGNQKDVEEYKIHLAEMNEFLDEAQKEIQNPERAKLITEIHNSVDGYDAAFQKVVTDQATRTKLEEEQLVPAGLGMRQDLTDIMSSAYADKDAGAAYNAGRAQEHLLLMRLYVAKFLEDQEKEELDRAWVEAANLKGYFTTLDQTLQNPRRRQLLRDARDKFEIYQSVFKEVSAVLGERNELIHSRLDKIGPSIADAAEAVKLSCKTDQDRLGPIVQALAEDTQNNILWLSAGAAVVALALALFLVNTINALTSLMKKLVNDLFGSSDQLASASSQISSAAQQLSSGASEQAAGLEETSSTMEQVSGQSRDNAASADQAAHAVGEMNQLVASSGDSAKTAAELAQITRKASHEGVSSMAKINNSMAEINEASNKVADIIEVINEITHQTKMLATNAAIEAARAGEQGKGFAVVADEVSKLAESSKTAAKEIAQLVKGAAEKARAGNLLAAEGEKVLQNINDVAVKVADSIEEIAGYARTQATKMAEVRQLVENIKLASNEQANGVEQISQALAEMDQVTQTNAANAEESASAAEELNAQAETLRQMVEDVAKHFGVKRSGEAVHKITHLKAVKALPHEKKLQIEAAPTSKAKPKGAGFVSAKDSIPMRDDFSSF